MDSVMAALGLYISQYDRKSQTTFCNRDVECTGFPNKEKGNPGSPCLETGCSVRDPGSKMWCDRRTLQKRPSKCHGQGFILRDARELVESDVIIDSICYLTLKKKDWATKPNGDSGKLFYEVKKKEHPYHRKLKHLGHILQRNDPTRDILQLVISAKLEPKSTNPANLVKIYQKDLCTPDFYTWRTLALTRRLWNNQKLCWIELNWKSILLW